MASTVVTEDTLRHVAKELVLDWLNVGRSLCLSESRLFEIGHNNANNINEAKYQMLLAWKLGSGREATNAILANALKANDRIDLAEYVGSSSVEKKSRFVKELMNKYKFLCGEIQPVPFLRGKYDIDQLFVPNGIKFLEEKYGEKREDENWTMLRDWKMVFTDPKVISTRYIIDGEPGYGKSTLALQIAHEWCQGMTPMNNFEVLILLRLRQFKNVPTVYSAIKRFLLPKDSKLTEDDIKNILDSSPTVILFDGYDEYPDLESKDNDIKCIIEGDMFQDLSVVLTTRTSCLPPGHSNAKIKCLRLTGFDGTSRERYIRNVVARSCSDDADNISKFLEANPVPADLCRIPLLFTMISNMVKNNKKFAKLNNVTQFFQHIIKCFHSHREMKMSQEDRKKKLDHSKLDEIAFEGLSGAPQQMSWARDKLRNKIGNDLYDEYIRIGILIEEEGFNFDTLEYYTETRFFHKLFAEWYAAHCLVKVATQPKAMFEPLPDAAAFQFWPRRAADTSQLHQAANSSKVHLLKSLTVNNEDYMCRYACGLNHEAALKIINHLGKNRHYDEYTLLCITEWSGSLEAIKDTVTELCFRGINISNTGSLLLHQSKIALIDLASSRKIYMKCVELSNCLDVGYNGKLLVKPFNLSLPVINSTLSKLLIFEHGRNIMEEEIDSILQYSAKCMGLKNISFYYCLPPRYIKVTKSMCVLRQRDVEVWWNPGSRYLLNLDSGQWEYCYVRIPPSVFRRPMTDKQYQEAVEQFGKWAEMPTRQLCGGNSQPISVEIEQPQEIHP